MMVHLDDFIAILACTLATVFTRVSGFWLADRLPKSGRFRRAMDALPASVLTAVIAPAAMSGTAEMISAGLCIVAATRLPLLATLALGMASVAILRQFF